MLLSFLLGIVAVQLYRRLRGQPNGSQQRVMAMACLAIFTATIGHGLVDSAPFLLNLAVDFGLAIVLYSAPQPQG